MKKHHRQELQASGISAAVIAACRFDSVSAEQAAQFLRWSRIPFSGGLLLPYFAPDGEPILCRIKLDEPRTIDKDGKQKTVKYEAPPGSRARLYVPPPAVPDLQAKDKPLLVTEGEKKAASLVSHGFVAVAISGVTCWRDAVQSRESGQNVLLADFHWCQLQDRRVALVFDSDAARNPQVRRQEVQLAQALRQLGATVACVRLPPGPHWTKVGVDDFLVAHGPQGPQQLQTLIDGAFQTGSARTSGSTTRSNMAERYVKSPPRGAPVAIARDGKILE